MTSPSTCLETIDFEKCPDTESGIHSRECYVMFESKQNGLAKIIRALKAYHSPPKEKFRQQYDTADEAMFVESYVGIPHYICESLEKLQFLRFQTVCDMQFGFITPEAERVN